MEIRQGLGFSDKSPEGLIHAVATEKSHMGVELFLSRPKKEVCRTVSDWRGWGSDLRFAAHPVHLESWMDFL